MKNAFFLVLTFFLFLDNNYSQNNTVEDPLAEHYKSLTWRNIGPFRGGRSCAVTGVAGKPLLYYFGATGGGVWKTKDGGQSWKNISDGFFGGSIGSIAVAPSDNNVIYVGGGEKTVRGNVSSGSGMWKSENAGKTWVSIGLKDSRHVGRIRIDPNNHNIVYAAVMGNLYKSNSERGIFKSKDGGKSWNKVLFVNSDVGFVDLCIDPSNARIMYASSWKVSRTPYSLSSGGEGSAIWKSTDYGETWKDISKNEGLPSGVWGISGIAVSPVNGDRVYALIENDKGGLYSSNDGGETWKKQNDNRSLRQRAWYYTRIYADTHDENTVYVMNVSYHKSVDGGKSFKSNRAPHGDHHDFWIAPEDPNRMIIGDDGGAQISYDGGENYSTYYNQPTAQFYRVTTDNHFPYRIYAAQQDNSTVRIAHRTTGRSISEDNWESTAGGESAHIAVDPDDNEIIYGGSYGGFLTRVNHRRGTVRAINVWPDNPMGYGAEGMKYRFQWNFPIFFSRHNSDKLYTGSNHLHMSTDEGQSWEIISPDLTRNDPEKLKSSGGPITQDNTGVEYYCTIFAANESPLKEGMLWVGSDDGLVHLTEDGGANWGNVTPKNMPEWMMINSVEPSVHDENTCYIAGTMYKHGDFQPYLYKTNDKGRTWRKIVNGIDSEHFTRVVREDPERKGILYAGTESGMYISYNDGDSWHPFQINLPIVPVTDLTIKQNNLIAATQGRGLWIIDDLTVLHQLSAANKPTQSYLLKPMDSYRMGGSQSKNNTTSGTNHPGGVLTHFFVKDYDEKKDTVSLTYFDPNGKEIRAYSTKAKEKRDKIEVKDGANMYAWNLSYPDAKSFEGMIFWSGSMAGPKAVPGAYTIELKHNAVVQKHAFNLLRNPNSETTDADIQSQFDFINSVNNKVTEAHQAIIDMRSLKKQIKTYTDKIENEEIKDYASNMDSIMTEVEKNLYQTKNKSGQDPLNYPIRLTNKLSALNSLTQMGTGDFPPTAAAIKVRDEMTGKIDIELNRFYKVKDEMLPALNQLIKDKNEDVIILKE